jgi:hypothetical protein
MSDKKVVAGKESVAALRKQLRESLPKVAKMPRDEVVAHLVKLGKRDAAAPVEKVAEPVAEKKVEKKKPSEKPSPPPMKKEATEKAKSARPAAGSPEAKARMAEIRAKRKQKIPA